mgnify:CR=1 FL=1
MQGDKRATNGSDGRASSQVRREYSGYGRTVNECYLSLSLSLDLPRKQDATGP